LLVADMLLKLLMFATPPPWMLPTAALMSMSPPTRVIVPPRTLTPPPLVSNAPPLVLRVAPS
jgi:hypothetical protein